MVIWTSFQRPPLTTPLRGTKTTVLLTRLGRAQTSPSATGARDVFVGDMDGDGDLDIVSASVDDDTLAWYEADWTTSSTSRVTGATAWFVAGPASGSFHGGRYVHHHRYADRVEHQHHLHDLRQLLRVRLAIDHHALLHGERRGPNSLEYAPDNMTLEKARP